MKAFRHLLLGVAGALALAAAAQAQAPAGTLQRIKETGEIRIGHRDVSVPFSYLTDDGKPIGFFIDICNRVVDTIKADLKQDVKVVLLSHSPDLSVSGNESEIRKLAALDAQISSLSSEYGIGFQDLPCLFDFTDQVLGEYMSWSNHPNAQGHALIARALLRWFPLVGV